MYRIYLVNLRSLGTSCGYGEGPTRQEAINNALEKARERDPNAVYDESSNQVLFTESVYL